MNDSNLEELIDRVWPHNRNGEPHYRKDQKAVIIDVMKAFYEDDYDNYILSAPTGFGKSPVCLTVAQVGGILAPYSGSLEERAKKALASFEVVRHEEHGYYVTPQNILLDQLNSDYRTLPSFGMFKGRSHYTCSEDPTKSCEDGPCRFDDDLQCDSYGSARDSALSSPVTNTNFVLYMVHPDVEMRSSLVVDEAHMTPEYVQSHVEIKLREDRLSKYVWEIPRFDDFQGYVDWMKPKADDLQMKVEEMEEQIQVQSSMNGVDQSLVREYEKTKRLANKFERLVNDWRYNNEEWVVNHTTEYDERKGKEIQVVTFEPITPYRFMEFMVFGKGNKRLISSATPPEPDLLGLETEETVRLTVESPFPVENRPCYVDPVGQMSSGNRSKNVGDVAEKVVDVSEGNTLIHAHTYDFADELYDALSMRVGGNVMVQDGGSREKSLEKWKRSDKEFFVSVNMYDGLDLKDDLCRTNVVCVVPFPYLGDPQVQRRKEEEGDRFFNWRTAMRIQQAYGRTTRSRDDWSDTYILDENFAWFYRQNRRLFFDWFVEALEWQD